MTMWMLSLLMLAAAQANIPAEHPRAWELYREVVEGKRSFTDLTPAQQRDVAAIHARVRAQEPNLNRDCERQWKRARTALDRATLALRCPETRP